MKNEYAASRCDGGFVFLYLALQFAVAGGTLNARADEILPETGRTAPGQLRPLRGIGAGASMAAKEARASLENLPFDPKDIAISEHLGGQVATHEIRLRDESGKEVQLSQYFGSRKPVLLALVYFECPSLCNLVLNGILKGVKALDWVPGQEFEIVTVSIKPQETPELAAKKKANYVQNLGPGKLGAADGWHFLTGSEEQTRKLADQVGFGYRWDPRTQEYAHSAAIFILTPEGKISRYLYGVDYSLKDLKLSLLEASGGKIGTVIDRILLFCYRYDPITRKYSVYLTRLLQGTSLGLTILLGGYLLLFWSRQRREKGRAQSLKEA